MILTNKAVAINKVNWKKVNSSLFKSGLKNTEINVLDRLFTTVIDTHTELSALVFMRQYMISVLFRLHHYVKEFNMIQDSESLRDLYDYILSSMMLGIEIATNWSYADGLSYLITRIMNRIFDIDTTNSYRIVLDTNNPFEYKIIVEPVISKEANKISIEKAKEYIDFIFNLFSFCEASNKFVSFSVMISSMWVNGFRELPYMIDDSIIPDFSINPANQQAIASLMLNRRKFILGCFAGTEEGLDLNSYSVDTFLREEPEELYDEMFKLYHDYEDEPESEEEFLEESEDEDILTAIIDAGMEGDRLPAQIEEELNMFSSCITDLNCVMHGSIPKSNIANRKKILPEFPRVRALVDANMAEKFDLREIIKAVDKYEQTLKNDGQEVEVLTTEERIKITNDAIKRYEDEKAEKKKILDEAKENEEICKKLIDSADINRDVANWFDFQDFFNEVLSIKASKNSEMTVEEAISVVNGFNANKPKQFQIGAKHFQKGADGSICFDHVKGRKILDKCVIQNGRIVCKAISEERKRK